MISTGAEDERQKPQRPAEQAFAPARVEILKLPAATIKEEARRNRSEERALVSVRVQWAILVVVGLYTIASFLQLQEARSINVSEDRPYVVLVPLTVGLDPAKPGSARAEFAIQDLGRSPALHVRTASQVFVGDSSSAVNGAEDSFFNDDANWTSNYVAIPSTTIGDNRITIDSAFVPASQQMQRAMATEGGIKGVARVEYSDMRGQTYVAEGCAYRMVSGQVADCDGHNGVR